jgi:Domain of Unknown Function (DUF1080)
MPFWLVFPPARDGSSTTIFRSPKSPSALHPVNKLTLQACLGSALLIALSNAPTVSAAETAPVAGHTPAKAAPTPYEHTAPTNPALPPPDADIWRQTWHDTNRPMPPVSTPLPEEELEGRSKAPSNAVILFDGKDLSAWQPSRWIVRDGYVEVAPSTGDLLTKQPFGSMKLHLEWWTPEPKPGQDGQKRNNSGVLFMDPKDGFEIQVLDSYNNPKTYADGIAGAVYGQYPPASNPSRPPGHWQYYDITFHRPKFDAQGRLTRAATVTVDFNGVRVQDNTVIIGSTHGGARRAYKVQPDDQPLGLQDHHDPVRYRNIWAVPIKD